MGTGWGRCSVCVCVCVCVGGVASEGHHGPTPLSHRGPHPAVTTPGTCPCLLTFRLLGVVDKNKPDKQIHWSELCCKFSSV